MAISIIYFVTTVSLEMFLGTLIALLLHRLSRATNIIISLLLTPMFIAPVIVGRLGRLTLAPSHGLLAWLLTLHGVNAANILGRSRARSAISDSS